MCDRVIGKTTSCEDMEIVISLPFGPQDLQYTKSVSIGDFMDKQRQKYEILLVDMRSEIDLISLSVDKEANALMELAYQELEMIKQEAKVGIASVEQWNLARNKSSKLKNHISSTVNGYYEELKLLELNRKQEIMGILIKYKEKIIKTGMLDMKEVEEYFNSEIDNINKKMLSSLQSYEDFYLSLLAIGIETNKTLGYRIKDEAKLIANKKAENLWKRMLVQQNKSLFVETVINLTQENLRTREDISQATSRLVGSLTDLAEIFNLSEVALVQRNMWDDWIESLTYTIEDLDRMSKNLADLFKNAVGTLMENFDSKINSLTRQLVAKFVISQDQSELANVSQDISAQLEMLNSDQSKELDSLRNAGKEVVDIIGLKMIRAKKFVDDLKIIWSEHLCRTKNMQQQLKAEWKSFHEANLKKTFYQFSKIKNLTKSIRESKDLNCLNSSAKDADTQIKNIEEMLHSDFELQKNCLLDIKTRNVKIISEENHSNIDTFLHEKYLKSHILASNQCWFTNLDSNDSDMQTQIDICNTFMSAVDNRILGMYETLERFFPKCKEKAEQESNDWFREFMQDNVPNHATELIKESQNQRNIICEINQIRSSELNFHSDRLRSHALAVKAIVEDLYQQFQDASKTVQALDTEFALTVVNLTEVVPLDTSKQIRDVILQLENHWSLTKEKMESCVTGGKINCEGKHNIIKNSNNMFSKAAKGFKNGGNYSPEELKSLTKELKQLEKTCTSQKTTLLKKYSNLINKLLPRQSLDIQIGHLKEKLVKSTALETIHNTLCLVKSNLKGEVRRMNDSGRQIGDKISNLSTLSKVDEELVNEICNLFNLRYDYMKFPQGVITFEPPRLGNDERKRISDNKATQPLKKGKEKIKSEFVPIFTQLFINANNALITHDHNFFALTKGLMLKKFNNLIQDTNLQSVSVKNKNTLNSKRITISNEDEGNSVEAHFKSLVSAFLDYNKECEAAWYCEAMLFIDQVICLRKNLVSLINLEMEIIHNKYTSSILKIHSEYRCTVDRNEKKEAEERERLLRTLALPLAHPNHKHKLVKLHQKAKDLFDSQKGQNVDSVLKYKATLQREHDEYVCLIKALKDKLTNIQSLVNEHPNNFDIFIDRCHSVRDLVQSEVKMSNNDTALTEEVISTYPISIWSSTDSPRGYCTSLTSSVSANDNLKKVESSVNKIAIEKIKESAELIQKLYDEIKISQLNNEKRILEWLKSFETNIDQSKLIYESLC